MVLEAVPSESISAAVYGANASLVSESASVFSSKYIY